MSPKPQPSQGSNLFQRAIFRITHPETHTAQEWDEIKKRKKQQRREKRKALLHRTTASPQEPLAQKQPHREKRQGLLRRATTPSREPLTLIPFTFKSLIIRAVFAVGIPAAIAAFFAWQAPWDGFVRDSNIFGAFISVGVWGLACWCYAQFGSANEGNDRARPLKSVGILVLVITFCLMACAFVAWIEYLRMTHLSIMTNGNDAAPWSTYMAQLVDSFVASGLPVTLTLFTCVRIASWAWRRWSEAFEASEALWWLDAGVRVLKFFAHLFAVLAVGTSLALLCEAGLYSNIPLWFNGPWWAGVASLAQQLAQTGMLWVLAAACVLRVAWRRFKLWNDVRTERERSLWKQQPDPKPDLAISAKTAFSSAIASIVRIVCLTAIVLAFIASALALVYPEGLPSATLLATMASALTTGPLAGALVACVALYLARLAKNRWAMSSGKTHGFLCGLATFGWVLAAIATAGLALYGIVCAQQATGVFSTLGWQLQSGLENPNIWGCVIHLVIIVVIVIIVLYIVVMLIPFDGGVGAGGGGGGYAAGGGGGGSGFGSSSDPKRQNVNDRYGRKLVEVDDSGIFSPTTLRDRHGAKIGTARESWDGSTHVSIGDDEYRVREALFSSDKIVEKDGEEVGRIRESGQGDERFYKK